MCVLNEADMRSSLAPLCRCTESVRTRIEWRRCPVSSRTRTGVYRWLALALCTPAGAVEPLRLEEEEEEAEGFHVYMSPHHDADCHNLGAIGNAGGW